MTTPPATIEPPAAADPLVVHLIDRKTSAKSDVYYDLALQVGDRVGPIAEPQALAKLDEAWQLAVSAADLPTPAPQADAILASRAYRTKDAVETMVLARTGDALVVWDRQDDAATPGEWVERAHVPLPAGAKLDVR